MAIMRTSGYSRCSSLARSACLLQDRAAAGVSYAYQVAAPASKVTVRRVMAFFMMTSAYANPLGALGEQGLGVRRITECRQEVRELVVGHARADLGRVRTGLVGAAGQAQR